MTIDILLATYNGAGFLQEQLESLLEQSFQEFGLIVRDDGSSDETVSILHRYAPRFEGRMWVVPSEGTNLGVIGNFDTMLAVSKADYVMFCDQDDIWHPDKVAISLAVIQELERREGRQKPLLVHCDGQLIDSKGKELAPHHKKKLLPHCAHLSRLLMQNVIQGCSTIINRALVDIARPIPENARGFDTWLGLAASSCGQIAYIDAPLLDYRLHENNVIGVNKEKISDIPKRVPYIMQRNVEQAGLLLNHIGPHMKETNRKLTESFVKLPGLNKAARASSLIRHRYLRRPYYQNIPIIIFY